MVRIRVYRLRDILYYVAIALLVIMIIIFAVGMFKTPQAVNQPVFKQESSLLLLYSKPVYLMAQENVPIDAVYKKEGQAIDDNNQQQSESQNGSFFGDILWTLLGFNPNKPQSYLSMVMPGMDKYMQAEEIYLRNSISKPQFEEEEYPQPADNATKTRVEIIRKTKASDEKLPQILIYHTHTQEAYSKITQDEYVEVSSWRTADFSHSVVRVGQELKKELEKYGFSVLQDSTNHEPPKLGTAYARSLQTMLKDKEQSPNIEVFIDLHRDAYTPALYHEDGISINGKKAAEVMFVVGNGQTGFSQMPNWRENLALAQKITQKLNTLMPGIAKTPMIRTGRYNQHVSDKSLLVEIGHNKNTLEEVLRTVPYLAKAVAQVFSTS